MRQEFQNHLENWIYIHRYISIYTIPCTSAHRCFFLVSKLYFSKQQKNKPITAVVSEAFLSVPELCCINSWLSWYTSEKRSYGLAHTLIHQNKASCQQGHTVGRLVVVEVLEAPSTSVWCFVHISRGIGNYLKKSLLLSLAEIAV